MRRGLDSDSCQDRQGRGDALSSDGDIESNPGPVNGVDVFDLAYWPIGFPTPWLGRPGPLRRAFDLWRAEPYPTAVSSRLTLLEMEGFVYEGGTFVHGVRRNEAGHWLVFESWLVLGKLVIVNIAACC